MEDVIVEECCFSTPRIIMHRCLASTTTPTPCGLMALPIASAICVVRRSCTCTHRTSRPAEFPPGSPGRILRKLTLRGTLALFRSPVLHLKTCSTFATRMRDTAFKRSLKKMPLGTDVAIDSPMVSFTLHKNSAKPAMFLAGGIGITPFVSIVRQADHDRLPHKLYLSDALSN